MTATEVVRDFGQLFIMAFDGRRLPADAAEFFATFRIGGVILFADNYESPAQLKALTAELQAKCGHEDAPLFISTDHEGGRVQRFREGFTRVAAMAEFGRRPEGETDAIYSRVGAELHAAGVNMNFAPVADLCTAETPGAIGDRSFGCDPDRVSAHVVAALQALQRQGVIACVKHFPGHGATDVDSHRDLPVINLSLEALEARDLKPFRAAFNAGVAAVMTAHALYPACGEEEWPASLSLHVLQSLVRDRYGFDGLIVTDAIEMAPLVARWGPVECGFQALRARADVLLYYKEAHQFLAFDALRRALERGEIDPAPVARSLRRVRDLKRRFLSRSAIA
jgi:beta-N-acetylhexosaminidase